MEALKQGPQLPVPVAKQIVFLQAVSTGLCDDLPVKQIGEFERRLYLALEGPEAAFTAKLEKSGDLTADLLQELGQVLARFKESFQKS
jgi:F-type H+-transporting ATPase subunit alpha